MVRLRRAVANWLTSVAGVVTEVAQFIDLLSDKCWVPRDLAQDTEGPPLPGESGLPKQGWPT